VSQVFGEHHCKFDPEKLKLNHSEDNDFEEVKIDVHQIRFDGY
jgi:hypothetical protein